MNHRLERLKKGKDFVFDS